MTRAEVIVNPGHTVVQGTMIQAVLETAMDSTLPGVIRAVISATAEIMIEPIDGTIERRQNPATGINEMKFQA